MTCIPTNYSATPHTPGPWEVSGERDDPDGLCVVQQATGGLICLVESTPGYAAADEANARRIVATVNGCQGIPTEALEQGVVAELFAACQRVIERWERGDLAEAVRQCSSAIAKATTQDFDWR